MKTIISAYRRRLALALFVLAAGCCYSCGHGAEAVPLARLSGETDAVSASDEGAEEGFAVSGGAGSDLSSDLGSDGRSTDEEASLCYVHVCGEVVHPGVYRLAEGRRIFEAVELAGGFTDEAADSSLNLAEPIHDGMKIEVLDRQQAAESVAASEAESDGRVNLNTADLTELMTLRGIGQARAEDIIAFRQKRGGFQRIEEIMEVPGIKQAAFEKIKNDITID